MPTTMASSSHEIKGERDGFRRPCIRETTRTEVARSCPRGGAPAPLQPPDRRGLRHVNSALHCLSRQEASVTDGRGRERSGISRISRWSGRLARRHRTRRSARSCSCIGRFFVLILERTCRMHTARCAPVVVSLDEVRAVLDLWSAKMMCAAFLGVTRPLAPGDIRGACLPGSASRQHRDVVAPDARRCAVARASVNPGPISVSSSAVA